MVESGPGATACSVVDTTELLAARLGAATGVAAAGAAAAGAGVLLVGGAAGASPASAPVKLAKAATSAASSTITATACHRITPSDIVAT